MAEPSVSSTARLMKFLRKPARQKLESITFRWRALFQARPTVMTLPFGAKWLAGSSAIDGRLRSGGFESAEAGFVQKFLQPGMTVLDIGAHHGFYTLLASVRVGKNGKVFAFEPSPRECKRLEAHIRLNKCSNVQIEPYALASEDTQADLFLVDGAEDYCNSLRPPVTHASTRTVRVKVTSLDKFLLREGIRRVDFVKLDTEGAEREVLRGATSLLQSPPRPVVLSEIAEIRTAPWGYSASEIIQFMEQRDYRWFSILPDGTLSKLNPGQDLQDTNLVAVPKERSDELLRAFGIE